MNNKMLPSVAFVVIFKSIIRCTSYIKWLYWQIIIKVNIRTGYNYLNRVYVNGCLVGIGVLRFIFNLFVINKWNDQHQFIEFSKNLLKIKHKLRNRVCRISSLTIIKNKLLSTPMSHVTFILANNLVTFSLQHKKFLYIFHHAFICSLIINLYAFVLIVVYVNVTKFQW